ncbi:hypothetical protein HHI36_006735 [Cryptolaemus montrouzieri]|uniref:Uncharacterized protein n=1 Tax=Cryptolaemus montrouzieri TaxID=559131 RepID=A0ABD2NY22_9CUCU
MVIILSVLKSDCSKAKDKDEFEEFCKTQTIPSLPLQECIYEESNSPINCNPDDLNTTTGDQPIITSDEHRISTSVSNEQPTTSSAHDDTQFQSLTSMSSSLTPEKEISSENKNKKPVCLFCDTIEKKVGKKRNYVAFPRSETTVNTIRVMAEKLNDIKLLAKLNSNQSVAYHSNCLSLYQLSVRRHDKERPEPTDWHKNRQLHQLAFDALSEIIRVDIIEKNRVMYLTDLFSQYKSLLLEFGEGQVRAEDIQEYRAENLESKIIKAFGDRVTIECSMGTPKKNRLFI